MVAHCPICGLEVCGLGFGMISRSMCECSSKKKLNPVLLAY